MQGVCWNVVLPIVGGAELCKRWHMGGTCFLECPGKGSHIRHMSGIVDKLSEVMATARAPPPAKIGA